MNETRKQIIELIGSYMDKVLTWWCLLERNNEIIQIVYETWIKNTPYFCILLWEETNQSPQLSFNPRDYPDVKIIWHYDITAVLKYLYEKWIYDEIISEMFIRFQTMKNINWWDTIFIPNKPLHLYSEQEEKQLLDLLIKLK